MSVMAMLRAVDWKRTYALTCVYGLMYDIIAWPMLFWGTTILTASTDRQIPGPPLVPYEHLFAAFAGLGVVGAVQFVRDRADEVGRSKHHEISTRTVEMTEKTDDAKPRSPGLA